MSFSAKFVSFDPRKVLSSNESKYNAHIDKKELSEDRNKHETLSHNFNRRVLLLSLMRIYIYIYILTMRVLPNCNF